MSTSLPPARHTRQLADVLAHLFSGPERSLLVQQLNARLEEIILRTTTADEEAQAIIRWFDDRDRSAELIAAIREKRPKALPPDFGAPSRPRSQCTTASQPAARSSAGGTAFPAAADGSTADVLILTALKEEYDEARNVDNGAIGDWTVDNLSGFEVAFRTYRGADGSPLRVALSWATRMRTIATAEAAGRLLDVVKPRCLAMSGVCAGRRGKVQPGDVIVGSLLYTYDTGAIQVDSDERRKPRSRFKPDPDPVPLDEQWLHRAQAFKATAVAEFRPTDWLVQRPPTLEAQGNWVLAQLRAGTDPRDHAESSLRVPAWKETVERLRKRRLVTKQVPLALTSKGITHIEALMLLHRDKLPATAEWKVHVAPIATGNNVMRDPLLFDRLSDSMREVLGVEMEAAAIGRIAMVRRLHWIVMKGVMDHADDDKEDGLKLFAARASAECLLSFVRHVAELRRDVDVAQESHFESALDAAHPTEGLATSGVASRLLVDPIYADLAPPSFDVGTAWGLSRGRTIGLLAGFHGALLFESLTSVEEMLFEAALRAGRSLPSRFWFRLRFDRPTAEPADEARLYALLATIDAGPRSAWLARAGWPDDVALGLLLEAPFESESQWGAVEPSLSAWLQRLVCIGSRRPLDVIVHVQARTRVAAAAAVERLHAGLHEDVRVSVEAVRLRDAPAQAEALDAAAQAEALCDFGFAGAGATAAHEDELARWLTCAGVTLQAEATDRARRTNLAAEHPKIVALIQSLRVRPDPDAVPGPAAHVLARLDQIAAIEPEVDAQLLSFVDMFLPGYTGALLRAYGTGARASGQRAALRFASRTREHADAYVDGALAAGRFPSARDLPAAGGGATEILRSLQRRQSDPRAAPHLAALASHIALLGIQAAHTPAQASLEADADAAAIWELLAEPITRDGLDAILRAPLPIRAAFGLIDAAEWKTVVSDEHRLRRVLDMRADRSLCFELPALPPSEAF